MGFLSVLQVIVAIANKVTKDKRIIIGKDDKIIIDIDRLPAGDPGKKGLDEKNTPNFNL